MSLKFVKLNNKEKPRQWIGSSTSTHVWTARTASAAALRLAGSHARRQASVQRAGRVSGVRGRPEFYQTFRKMLAKVSLVFGSTPPPPPAHHSPPLQTKCSEDACFGRSHMRLLSVMKESQPPVATARRTSAVPFAAEDTTGFSGRGGHAGVLARTAPRGSTIQPKLVKFRQIITKITASSRKNHRKKVEFEKSQKKLMNLNNF